jgi:hypothetical protein
LFSGVSVPKFLGQLSRAGLEVDQVSGQIVSLRVANQDLMVLASLDGVEWVSVRPQFKRFDVEIPKGLLGASRTSHFALTGFESGAQVLNLHSVWIAGWRGASQVVAAADSGLDTGDPRTLAKDFVHHHASFSVVPGSATWADFIGHGTHVMGSIGGAGLQSNGAITGTAPEARLMMQSVASEDGLFSLPDDLGEVFGQAYQNGARIHSNSWGTNQSGVYSSESSLVDQFMWEHPQMSILFAAGNEGADANKDGRIDPGSVSPPSTAKNVISVGASENLVLKGGFQMPAGELLPDVFSKEPLRGDKLSNNPGGLAVFSSRGPTRDGRMKPDLVAPGTNILSNCSQRPEASEMWGKFGDHYCFSGGTSMATPLVAGVAAVLREKLIKSPEFKEASAALIKAILLHTATDLFPGQFGQGGAKEGQEILKPGPGFDQGFGRVNAEAAVLGELKMWDEPGVGAGESQKFSVQELSKVTLVYTDAPGAPMASRTLVNDLRLEVLAAGNKIFTNESLRDNVEQVLVPQGQQGPFEVRVTGVSVPMGKSFRQPYALVISQ